MLIIRLAFRNLLGAGLRTWLNVFVLSLSFVAIIWTQGIYEGLSAQAADAVIAAEYGNGQYWQKDFDLYDPLTLPDAHAPLPSTLKDLISVGKATPILIVQGSIYPGGRIQMVLLKGIDPTQTVLSLPAKFLATEGEELPVLIGSRMANNTGLKKDDYVTVQWRDINGTFDAREARIVQVMSTTVQNIDIGQIWLPLDKLQALTKMADQATVVTLSKKVPSPGAIPDWTFKDLNYLLKDIHEMVQTKTVGATILYTILLFLAMLAIFDTQVLSIFRRRKEMGTLMALGMTRGKLIQLFTFEGTLHSVLAAVVGAIYGIPLLVYFATQGWAMPKMVDQFGYAIGEKIFPIYSAGLVLGTTMLVFIVTTVVSFLPTRRIAKLKPTDALRGRFS